VIAGVAVQRAGEPGVALGLVSVDAFARSFRAALADETIGGILLNIDSPGGGPFSGATPPLISRPQKYAHGDDVGARERRDAKPPGA
jgi:hypothetical protein